MQHFALFATLCGLTAAISWGLADFFAAKASKNDSPESAVFWVTLISAAIYSVVYLVHPGTEAWITSGIAYSSAAGVLMGWGLLLFYRGLNAGPVSIVSPIGSAYPLITTLAVLVLFGGSIDRLHLLGIFVVLAGIIVTSGIADAKKSDRKISSGVVYALLTFFIWGVAFALLGKAVSLVGWEKATLLDIYLEVVAVFIALPVLLGRSILKKQRLSLVKDKFILGAAVIQLFGVVIFNIGLTKATSAAIITAIAASYPALTIFLAVKHLGEKKQLIPLLGAFVTIIGIVILSYET